MTTSWITRAKRALQDQRGETLTEVLAAIVVSGLAILMLATVIAAASSMTARSRDAMNVYFESANNVAVANTNGTGTVAVQSDDGPIQFTDNAVDYKITKQANDLPVVVYEAHGEGTP